MKPAKDSEILRAARRRIEQKKNDFICHALDAVRVGTPAQKTELKRWVECMLQGAYSYAEWLEKNHLQTYREMLYQRNQLRIGRLAWLDWMIEQCELAQAREQKEAT